MCAGATVGTVSVYTCLRVAALVKKIWCIKGMSFEQLFNTTSRTSVEVRLKFGDQNEQEKVPGP